MYGTSVNKDGRALGKFHADLPLVALWLQEQRIRFERNKLESGHKERLVAMAALSPDTTTPQHASPRNLQTEWLQRLDELRRFKRITGHCSVRPLARQRPHTSLRSLPDAHLRYLDVLVCAGALDPASCLPLWPGASCLLSCLLAWFA